MKTLTSSQDDEIYNACIHTWNEYVKDNKKAQKWSQRKVERYLAKYINKMADLAAKFVGTK